ncbi:GNAT family N-acetyltransferase [Lysinibacillus fusiformis]|uniref:GNAT family N-acetyltransferase n=1 Tax=Lysinibacillus fusiformis TaxID=28031 RepID=UPI003818636F
MFTFLNNDLKFVETEKDIMNSNQEYNLIAYDKKVLGDEDILEIHEETAELQIERYLVKKGDDFIAILDYGMSSPRHQKPWISLLAVHKKYQGLGYAKKIYMLYEERMRSRKVNCIHIAVHSTNKNAVNFWSSLGFIQFDERIYEDQVILSFEKILD